MEAPHVFEEAELPTVELKLDKVPFSVEVEAVDGPYGLGDAVVEDAC
jgi:hypothetical protein